jgi:hypothetical protein
MRDRDFFIIEIGKEGMRKYDQMLAEADVIIRHKMEKAELEKAEIDDFVTTMKDEARHEISQSWQVYED